MPLTRRTYSRKKAQNSNISSSANRVDENEKENINPKKKSRAKTTKKIKKTEKTEEAPEESFNLTMNIGKTVDAFDILCSSPMKQEVSFKPLSFWSQKVKDLESKQKTKKKCELYELSDTDDSTSSTERKKVKRKGRGAAERLRKTKKRTNKPAFQYNMNTFAKKYDQKTKSHQNKDCSIVRERIILRRLNDKLLNEEDKFSLNKISSLGLTSTPVTNKQLNVVGGSNFDFLSPISCLGNNPNKTENDSVNHAVQQTVVECKNKKSIVNLETPTRKNGENGSGNNETREKIFELDLTLQDPVNSSELIKGNCTLPENLNLDICLGDQVNQELKTYQLLKRRITKNREHTVSEILTEKTFNFDTLRIYILLRELLHLFFFRPFYQNSAIDLRELSPCKSFTNHSAQMFSFSLQHIPLSVTEQQSHDFKNDITEHSKTLLDEYNSAETIGNTTVGFVRNSSVVSDEIFSTTSFCHVTVRRGNRVFLNFRRSKANAEICDEMKCHTQDFNNTRVNSSDTENSDKVAYSFHRESAVKPLPSTENTSSYLESDKLRVISSHADNSLQKPLLTKADFAHRQKNRNVILENSFSLGSNRYRSKEIVHDACTSVMMLSFHVGNDSSGYNWASGTGDSASFNKIESTLLNLNNVSVQLSKKSDNDLLFTEHKNCSNYGPTFEVSTTTDNPKQVGNGSKEIIDNAIETVPLSSTAMCDESPIQNNKNEDSVTANLTFNDEFELPSPVFESTVCNIPVIRNNIEALKKKNVSELKPAENILTETCSISGAENFECKMNSYICESKFDDFASIRLKPGKQWVRSSLIVKKMYDGTLLGNETVSKIKGKKYQTFVEEVLSMQGDAQKRSMVSPKSVSMQNPAGHLSNMTIHDRTIGRPTVKILDGNCCDGRDRSFTSAFKTSSVTEIDTKLTVNEDCEVQKYMILKDVELITARDLVLMRCNQTSPLPFEEYFNKKTLKNCKKIGEGVFGEVFKYNSNRVIKIIPIEGSEEVNGERQKRFDEILSEMAIAMELSNLRNSDKFKTNGFSELKKCWCVIGEYPQYLLDLWNDFDCIGRGSENDSPIMFKPDQLFIVLDFTNGGSDLASFVFGSAEQSLAIFVQTACSLAVAERALEFEHRDLHWGNILISPTKEKYFEISLDGKEYKVPTKGVKVTIIDFTLSRMTYNGCTIFNDLSVDPTLFASEGDYQFEIYRMMRNEVMDDWSVFKPKTNLCWLHYVVDKMITLAKYKRIGTKIHNTSLSVLRDLQSSVLAYSDSEEFLVNEQLI